MGHFYQRSCARAHRRVEHPAQHQYRASGHLVVYFILVRTTQIKRSLSGAELTADAMCRTTQVLAWVVNPLMQGYADAGDFTFLSKCAFRLESMVAADGLTGKLSGGRLKSSIKGHLIYICIVGSLGVVGERAFQLMLAAGPSSELLCCSRAAAARVRQVRHCRPAAPGHAAV